MEPDQKNKPPHRLQKILDTAVRKRAEIPEQEPLAAKAPPTTGEKPHRLQTILDGAVPKPRSRRVGAQENEAPDKPRGR
jgi:hypothetical protein